VNGAGVGERGRILVVDDEEGIARMLQVLLESRGFSTLVAHSGRVALELLGSCPVDLVLLDIMMPGFDGHQVLKWIKGCQELRHLPVILVTAKDGLKDKVEGLRLGADDYITKPFNNEELLARVRVQLRISQMGAELRQRNEELSALNAIATAVNQPLDLNRILNDALDKVLEVLEAEGGQIRLVEERTGELVLAVHRGRSAEFMAKKARTRWEEHSLAPLREKGGVLILDDLSGVEDPSLQLARAEGYRSYLGIALRSRDRTVGTLCVLSRTPGRFKRRTPQFLTAIGHQVGVAIENARLFERTSEQVRYMRTVHEVSLSLNSTLELGQILKVFVERLVQVTGAKRCAVSLLTKRPNVVHLQVGYDGLRRDPWIGGLDLPLDRYPEIMAAIRSKQPVVIPDVMQEPLLESRRDILKFLDITSMLIIPLMAKDQVIGAISLGYVGGEGTFSEMTIEFSRTLASQLSVAIENARLFEEHSRLAITDELTGLYNYRYFVRALQAEVNRAIRYRRNLSLILLDLDHFKEYNDRWEDHQMGDAVLRQLAELLQRNTRDADVVARYGGDEFAIILPETTLQQAALQAERIRAAVEEHRFMDRFTVSLGVAALKGGERAEELIRRADKALYQAKGEGGNRVCLAHE